MNIIYTCEPVDAQIPMTFHSNNKSLFINSDIKENLYFSWTNISFLRDAEICWDRRIHFYEISKSPYRLLETAADLR